MIRFSVLLAFTVFIHSSLCAQEARTDVLEVNGGGGPDEIKQLVRILNRLWLFPEEYEGKTVQFKAFLFEAENFEPYPQLNGYLFACEPVVFAHNDQARVHIGMPRHFSLDKLNLFCTDEQGKKIRKVFKDMEGDEVVSADMTLQVRKGKDGAFLGVVTSFTPRKISIK